MNIYIYIYIHIYIYIYIYAAWRPRRTRARSAMYARKALSTCLTFTSCLTFATRRVNLNPNIKKPSKDEHRPSHDSDTDWYTVIATASILRILHANTRHMLTEGRSCSALHQSREHCLYYHCVHFVCIYIYTYTYIHIHLYIYIYTRSHMIVIICWYYCHL